MREPAGRFRTVLTCPVACMFPADDDSGGTLQYTITFTANAGVTYILVLMRWSCSETLVANSIEIK